MKLSFKNILPIILISALLILLAGCMGTVPTDESPGYTPGTITGIIASPCCSTSDDPVTETCCVSPEYWCYYCQETWKLQKGIGVVLTYGEDEVATTTTNDKGEFTFTNVEPGKNYVITAICPDDDRSLVKDVALQLVEGGSFDTKITDCISTSLGLVVDFLVTYTELGPEDINLEPVVADKPYFENFKLFKKLVEEVCRASAECGNLSTDVDVQDALCKAAEEVGQIVLPDLDLQCTPGFTPPSGPPPGPPPSGPCVGNTVPDITDVTLDAVSIFNIDPSLVPVIHLIVGTTYNFCVTATDIDGKLPQPLTYSVTIGGYTSPYDISNCLTITPEAEDVGTYNNVTVNVSDGCGIKPWGPITVVVDCCQLGDPALTINLAQTAGIEMSKNREITPTVTKCMDECVTIGSVTVHYASTPPGYDEEIFDLNDSRLVWTWDDGKVSFNKSTGEICLIDGETGTPGTYPIMVTYTDSCNKASVSIVVEFIDCCPDLDRIDLLPDVTANVCDDDCFTFTEVKLYDSDGTTVLETIALPDSRVVLTSNDDTNVDINDITGGVEVCLADGGIPNAYTITATYTDPCEVPYTATEEITFEDCSCQDPSANAGPDQCIQLNCGSEVLVNFDGSGSTGTGLTYAWDFDDPNDSTAGTGSTPSHTYTAAGTYTVTLTVTDSCDNSDSDEMELTIHSACGDLPSQLTISSSWTDSYYYLKAQFSNGGGDIVVGDTYNGWCAHSGLEGIPRAGDVMYAYCTLELDTYWPNINWIVNHRSGYSRTEVQYAIWHYIHGTAVTGRVLTLVTAADSHGNFCPTIGEKYVVLLTHNEIDTYGIYRCDHEQNILIEVQRVNHCISF